jgi:nucleotide-binding universal stress UspA family protein
MKKIIYPTDLSSQSEKGLRYAQYIAVNTGSELKLYHNIDSEEERHLKKSQLDACIEMLESADLRGAKTVRYSYECNNGFLVEELIKKIEKPKYKLLIMMTNGEEREHFQGLYLKSHTSSVLEKTSKPVLIYPSKSNVEKISKVLIAVDVLKYSKEALIEANDLLGKFSAASVTFFYACPNPNIPTLEAIERFKYFMNKYLPNCKLEVGMNETLEAALPVLIENEKCDLLVLTKFKHAFWEKWFVKSVSQHFAYHSTIPTLVLNGE